MASSKQRVRFAPSPTGYLHIGGARTALFNWLYARKTGGTFILRIEDTDQARSTDESLRAILESMKWLGLDWDEGPEVGGPNGPYKQTERLALYKEFADRMVREGTAYRCYATKEELDTLRKEAEARKQQFFYPHLWRDKTEKDWPADRPYVIRFKTPLSGETTFHDEVFGPITTPHNQIQDFILLRSDGIPLYNFGAVVDDITMGITLVARGRDHIINTAPQVLLYKALGYQLPRIAHLPMMLAPDGKKLSKREGRKYGIPISVTRFHDDDGPLDGYREMGVTPDALLCYLIRFGWSHGDQEEFTRQEMIDLFDFSGASKADGKFDIKKCTAISLKMLKEEKYTPTDEYLRRLGPFLEARGMTPRDDAWMRRALATYRERAQTLVQCAEGFEVYLKPLAALDPALVQKFLTVEKAGWLPQLRDALAAVDPFTRDEIGKAMPAFAEAKALAMKDIGQPTRVALTGKTATPGLDDVMEVLGKAETLARLDQAAALLR
ncbi:MAG: glutamate--tRNA ligase [Polyangiaceae bacterium]|jgi:glutamyl-tRNA synthetase|nr:glutamate--tRNA ligase [Polyangiaceae bacterium]